MMKSFVTYFFLLVSMVLIPIASGLSHANHGKMVEAASPYPTIAVELKNQNLSSYILEFKLTNFELIPLNDSSVINKNEGHIMLLINNKKKIMITEKNYTLSSDLLKTGKNELFVMLMDSKHFIFTKDENIIYVPKLIYKDK